VINSNVLTLNLICPGASRDGRIGSSPDSTDWDSDQVSEETDKILPIFHAMVIETDLFVGWKMHFDDYFFEMLLFCLPDELIFGMNPSR